jgi:Uma2 family endonuclease
MATTATMSGLQFDALPFEEGRRWELVEGKLIEVSGATPRHQMVVFRIMTILQQFLQQAGLALADVEFALSENSRLRPDVCVLLGRKVRALDLDRVPVPGSPDLAIEIISPTERTAESYAKVQTYLNHGTAEVWQVFPRTKTLQIHKPGSSRSLDSHQEVTTDLLPGFSAPVASLFEQP